MSHAIMSGGKPFHNQAPAVGKIRYPTVANIQLMGQ